MGGRLGATTWLRTTGPGGGGLVIARARLGSALRGRFLAPPPQIGFPGLTSGAVTEQPGSGQACTCSGSTIFFDTQARRRGEPTYTTCVPETRIFIVQGLLRAGRSRHCGRSSAPRARGVDVRIIVPGQSA